MVGALAFLLLIPWLGMKDFSTRGEAREALVAQAMVQTGNWILPSAYNGAIPSKPPLLHWLISLFSTPGGEVTEFTARLPSALGCLLFIVAFERFLRRRSSPGVSLLAPLILLTSIEWFRASVTCRVDMLLSVLLCGGLLLLYEWFEREMKGFPLGAAVLLTLATLTKGPVSIVLPGIIFGSFLLINRIPFLRIVRTGLIAFLPPLLLSTLWYFAAYKVGGERFLDKVYYENFARFTGTMADKPHSHSVFYLAAVLLAGFLPWTLIALTSLGGGIKLWWARERREMHSIRVFSLVVVLGVFAFYAIPSSKRSTYLLPLYPFLSLLVSEAIVRLSPSRQRWAAGMGALFVSLLLIVIGACVVDLSLDLSSLYSPSGREFREALYHAFLSLSPLGGGIVALLLTLSVTAMIRYLGAWRTGKPGGVLLALGFATFYFPLVLVNGIVLAPVANSLSPRSFTSSLVPEIRSASKLYSYGDEFYAVSFYSQRPMFSLSGPPQGDSVVILYERNLEKLQSLLAPGQSIEGVSRSVGSIVKPGERAVAVKVRGDAPSRGGDTPTDVAEGDEG